MANELTISAQLGVINGNISINRQINGAKFNQNTPGYAANVQTINTVATDANGTKLNIPTDVATLGYAFLRNQDATNFVTLGIQVGGTFEPFGVLKAGEIALLRLKNGVNYYASADTAALDLEWVVAQD